MVAAAGINITKVETSKLKEMSLENLPFGRYFTDHMLEADYENGEWKNVEIKPYQPMLLEPSLAALHYGQAIFEGIKAYKDDNGNAAIFRPFDNFKRFNLSAERMNMPVVPEEIFIEGMRMLIELDKNWIPSLPDHSLYIRPFMFSSDPVIGVKPSDTYKFFIILSPYRTLLCCTDADLCRRNLYTCGSGWCWFFKECRQLRRKYAGNRLQKNKATTRFYGQTLLSTNTCRK
jgi:branched-chain amino acid aminotransferase